MEKVRLVVRRILIVLLVIWMVVVFCLSHQNGESSGSLSLKVANFLAKGDTVLAESIEPVVRKVAHMTEYAIGAMLFYGITLTYPQSSRKKRVIISLAFVIVYAASDEFHQTFISARSGNAIDVFIDTVGGIMGIGALCVIETAIYTMDSKIKEDLKNTKLNR